MILFSIFVILFFSAIVIIVITLRDKIFSKPGEFGVYTKLATSGCKNGEILTSYWCNPSAKGNGCLNSKDNQSFDILVKSQKCIGTSTPPSIPSAISTTIDTFLSSLGNGNNPASRDFSISKLSEIIDIPIKFKSSLPPLKKGECVSEERCLSHTSKGVRKIYRKLGDTEIISDSTNGIVSIGGNGDEIVLLNGVTFKKEGRYYSSSVSIGENNSLFSPEEVEKLKNSIVSITEECVPPLPVCGIPMNCCSGPKLSERCVTPSSKNFERGKMEYEQKFYGGGSSGSVCECECILLKNQTKKFYFLSPNRNFGVGRDLSLIPIKNIAFEDYYKVLSLFAFDEDGRVFSFDREDFVDVEALGVTPYPLN